MTTSVQHQIARIYQASPLFNLTTPADAASGLASTDWAPVAAEIARHTGAGATAASRQTAYTQVVHMLRETEKAAARSNAFGPVNSAARQAFSGFVLLLQTHYERQLAA